MTCRDEDLTVYKEEYYGYTIRIEIDPFPLDPVDEFGEQFCGTDEYEHYLRGEVYGYTILGPGGDFEDSCWGYYENPMGYPLESAREIIDYLLAHEPSYSMAGVMV